MNNGHRKKGDLYAGMTETRKFIKVFLKFADNKCKRRIYGRDIK